MRYDYHVPIKIEIDVKMYMKVIHYLLQRYNWQKINIEYEW